MVYYLYFLITLIPFLVLSPLTKWFGVPTGIIFGCLAAVLVLGAAARHPDFFRWRKIKQTPLIIPLIGFIAANVLSVFRSLVLGGFQAVHLDTLQELVYFLFAAGFYWITVNFIDNKQKVNGSILAFMFGAVAASLYGLAMFYISLAGNNSATVDITYARLSATAGEPQVFAGFIISILPLVLAAVLYKISLLQSVPRYLSAFILLLALAATVSAGAIAGFGLALIILLLGVRLYNLRQLGAFLLVFVLVGGFFLTLAETAFPGYLSAFETIAYKYTAQIPAFSELRDKGDTSDEGTYKVLQKSESPSGAVDPKYFPSVRSKVERSWFRAALWNMFKSSPVLGVGPGNFGALYNSFRPPGSEKPPYVPKPHNQYLEILAETGLVGMLAFVWLVLSAVAILFRGWRTARRDDRKLLLGMAASLLAVGVHGYSFGILVHLQVWLLLAITMAWALILDKKAGGRYY